MKKKEKPTKNNLVTKDDLNITRDYLDKKINYLDKKIDGVERYLDYKIETLRNEIEDFNKDFKEFEDTMMKNVDWLVGSFKKFEEEHIVLTGTYSEIKEKLSDHEQRITTLEKSN